MRYCHYCNTLLQDGDTYCYVCGTSQPVPDQSYNPYYDSQQVGYVPPQPVSRPYTPPPGQPAPRPAYASAAPRPQAPARPYQPPMPAAAYPPPPRHPWNGYTNPQQPAPAPAPVAYPPYDNGYSQPAYQPPCTYGNGVPQPLSGNGADTLQGWIIGGVITALVLGIISIVLLLSSGEERMVTTTDEYSDTSVVVEEPQLLTVDPYPGN